MVYVRVYVIYKDTWIDFYPPLSRDARVRLPSIRGKGRERERFPKVSRGSLIEQGEEARSGPPPRERRFPKTSEEGWREEKEESEGGGGNLQIVPASNVSST